LLRQSHHTALRGKRDLGFKFDIVLEENNVYLNVIDVFPLVVSFLDKYVTCEVYVEKMAECTCKYMLDHSTDEKAWPM
jgi:hypothetical protein